MTIRQLILLPICFLTALGQGKSTAIADDGVEWGHFRFMPALTVSESYNDNLYHTNTNKKENYITTLSPKLSFDVAIAPKKYFSLNYQGDFLSYSDAENFKHDHHYGSFSFNGETAKGSHFIAAISAQDTAIQPFSIQEQSKDYTLQSAYVDLLARLGKVSDIGTRYSRQEREFDEQEFMDDDFTKDTWDVELVYTRSSIWPLLLQYRYVRQDNNDLHTIDSDFQTHTIFIGGRWRPERKFSGAFRIGYKWAEFDRVAADDYTGYTADTNITYAFTDATQITHTAQSTIDSPTRNDRESGEYYINTGLGFIFTHRMGQRITSRLNLLYRIRDYKEIQSSESIRKDEFYRIGGSINHRMREWISFSLGYRYQKNISDIAGQDYIENLITFGMTLGHGQK